MPPIKHNLNALVIAIAIASLTGCVVGPDYRPPCPPPTAVDYLAASSDEASCYDDLRFWWGQFNDPTLNQLVAIACRQSLFLPKWV